MWYVIFLACGGCSEAVKLVQDNPTGGVVTYSFKEDRGGPMGSPNRKKAFDLIEKKCGSRYGILREGETEGYTSASGTIEGTEDQGIGRRWGIKFECKPR